MTKSKKLIYVAAPLFSQAELAFNVRVKASLAAHLNVFLPQEDGHLLADLLRESVPIDVAVQAIFGCDVEAVRNCDALLIVLDGRAVDEGAVFELGLAFGLGKTCVGLQTDPRRLFEVGNNPMLTGSLAKLFHSLDGLEAWAANFGSSND